MNKSTPCILLVDDERSNISILNKILKDDYEIKVAMNGHQALERAISDPIPDIILLDIQMPDMDGYAVCEKFKSDPITKEIPVIFITALTQEESEEKGLVLGAVDYITKPLRPPIILARVKTHIRLKLALETLTGRNSELEETLALRETIEQISRHDLKTPLNGIFGVTQILSDDPYILENYKEMIGPARKKCL